MSKGSVTPMTIGLLVIGLLIGLGGGYVIANNSFNPKIEELETSTNALSTQLSDTNDQISDLGENLSSLASEEEEKESQLADLQNELSDSIIELNEVQAEFILLAEERQSLEEKVSSKDGYSKLTLYGFSLDYPDYYTLSILDTTGQGMDASYGTISGDNETEAFSIGWISVLYYDEILEVTLNGSTTFLDDLYDLNISSQYNETIAGFDGVSVDFEGYDEDGVYGYGKYFAFYSDSQSKLYIVSISVESQEDYTENMHIMNSLRLED